MLPSRFLYGLLRARTPPGVNILPIPLGPRCPPCQYVTVGTDDRARRRAQCRHCHQPPLTQ